MNRYELVFFFAHANGQVLETMTLVDANSLQEAIDLVKDCLGPGWKFLRSRKV